MNDKDIAIQIDKLIDSLGIFYLISMNVISFLMMKYDKYASKKKRKYRISEKTFIAMAFFGSCVGIILGMRMFRHKTLHKKFYLGVPLILIVQVLVFLYFIY